MNKTKRKNSYKKRSHKKYQEGGMFGAFQPKGREPPLPPEPEPQAPDGDNYVLRSQMKMLEEAGEFIEASQIDKAVNILEIALLLDPQTVFTPTEMRKKLQEKLTEVKSMLEQRVELPTSPPPVKQVVWINDYTDSPGGGIDIVYHTKGELGLTINLATGHVTNIGEDAPDEVREVLLRHANLFLMKFQGEDLGDIEVSKRDSVWESVSRKRPLALHFVTDATQSTAHFFSEMAEQQAATGVKKSPVKRPYVHGGINLQGTELRRPFGSGGKKGAYTLKSSGKRAPLATPPKVGGVPFEQIQAQEDVMTKDEAIADLNRIIGNGGKNAQSVQNAILEVSEHLEDYYQTYYDDDFKVRGPDVNPHEDAFHVCAFFHSKGVVVSEWLDVVKGIDKMPMDAHNSLKPFVDRAKNLQTTGEQTMVAEPPPGIAEASAPVEMKTQPVAVAGEAAVAGPAQMQPGGPSFADFKGARIQLQQMVARPVSPPRRPETPEPPEPEPAPEPAPAPAPAAAPAVAVADAPTAGPIPTTDWERLDSDDGMYFYNSETGVTTWEEPPEVTAAEKAHEALVSKMREKKAMKAKKTEEETEEVSHAIDAVIDERFWEPD